MNKQIYKINKKRKILIYLRRLIYRSIYVVNIFFRLKKPLITVYCYHSIADDDWRHSIGLNDFELQVGYLSENYKAITLNDLSRFLDGKLQIDKPSFIITFDDGYKNIIQTQDIFKRHKITPAIFLLSETANIDRHELIYNQEMLSTTDIKELVNQGWIIGSHGASHKDYNSLSEQDVLHEIATSKKVIKDQSGVDVKYFAYPKGRYTEIIKTMVKESGYELGLSMDEGGISLLVDKYAIPRVGVDKTHTFSEFVILNTKPACFFRKFLIKILKV